MAAAIPVRHVFSKATLGTLAPGVPGAAAAASAGALAEIRNWALTMTALLPTAQAADPNAAQTSTRALYDSIELYRTAFRKALAACVAGVRTANPWIQANQAVARLYQAWRAAVLLLPAAGPGAYVVDTAALNWPTESPLELIYETILNTLPLATFGALMQCPTLCRANGWAAIQGLMIPGNAHAECGMPRVGLLCFGGGAGGVPATLVVATNQPAWRRFRPLERWTRRARESSMSGPYKTRVNTLSRRLINHGGSAGVVPQAQNLQWHWDHPGGGATPDQAIMAAWATVCGPLPGVVNLPPGNTTFTRAAVTATRPFRCNPPGLAAAAPAPVCRCRRCRCVFRYVMNGEPVAYNGGPYTNVLLSCAEVLGYEKCGWSGL